MRAILAVLAALIITSLACAEQEADARARAAFAFWLFPEPKAVEPVEPPPVPPPPPVKPPAPDKEYEWKEAIDKACKEGVPLLVWCRYANRETERHIDGVHLFTDAPTEWDNDVEGPSVMVWAPISATKVRWRGTIRADDCSVSAVRRLVESGTTPVSTTGGAWGQPVRQPASSWGAQPTMQAVPMMAQPVRRGG